MPGMFFKTLEIRHPEWSGAKYEENRALYAGGDEVLCDGMLDRLLHKGADEPEPRYAARKTFAHYINHVAGMVDQFVAWLATEEPETKSDPDVVDEFYAAFQENCDQGETDFNQFFQDTLRDALLTQRAWVQVDLPDRTTIAGADAASTRLEESALGLDQPYLIPWAAENVTCWKRDGKGKLLWLITRGEEYPRDLPTDPGNMKRITWTIYFPDRWERYVWNQTEEGKKVPEPDEIIPLEKDGAHSFGQVPFIECCLPKGLYLLGKIRSNVIEQFNQRNALAWNVYCSLHATPVVYSKAEGGPKKFGGGYGIQLDPDDKIEYLEPTGAAHTAALSIVSDLKDEEYRTAHQMSLSASNSASAMQRSGDSKAQDQSSTEIVLCLYSQCESKWRQEVLNLVAAGRAEKIHWTVAPVDSFTIESSADVLAEVTVASALNIPSKKFAELMHKRAAVAVLPELDDADKAEVFKEIEQNSIEPSPFPEFTGGLGPTPKTQQKPDLGSGAKPGQGPSGKTAPGDKQVTGKALAAVNAGTSARRPGAPVRRTGK